MSSTPPPIKPLKQFPADSRVLAEELRPVLNQLEDGRQKALLKIRQGWKRIILCILITLVIMGFLFVGLGMAQFPNKISAFLFTPVLVCIIFCIVTYHNYIRGHSQAYQAIYKKEVIGGIAHLLHPGMQYNPTQGISENTFKQAGLYTDNIDRYSYEDLFAGRVGKTEIMFSEVHVQDKRRRTDSKGRNTTYWVTIFKGLFLIADFHKNFSGWLIIKPDFAESSFGWFGRKIQGFNPNLIRLENPDFERAFVVYGSDQVEARYILTPDMQERLLTLRNTYGTDIRLSLQNSQVNLTGILTSVSPPMLTPETEIPVSRARA